MPEWLLVAIGLLVGLAVIVAVFVVVNRPRPLNRKTSRLAERSGRSDEDGWSNNTGGWTPDA